MELARRIRELAAQPFVRPGAEVFDVPYAMSVWDARELVELADAVAKNPGKPVRIYAGHGAGRFAIRGFVPSGQAD